MKDNYIFKEYQDYLKKCSSTEQNYIYNRLINQIIWYDKQAIKKQTMSLYYQVKVSLLITT